MEIGMALEPSSIDALILAGGLGTRLKPLISDRPKPLAPVAGRPFIDHLLNLLSLYGFRSATLCVGHMAELFDNRTFAAEIDTRISREDEPLGTAGALAHALRQQASNGDRAYSDPLLVLNGDSISDGDLGRFLQWYHRSSIDNAIAGATVEEAGRYGSIVAGDAGRIQSFREKSKDTGSGLVNAGVYLLRREVIENLPKGRKLSLEYNVFPSLAGGSKAGLHVWNGCTRLIDIGTPESYESAGEIVANLWRDLTAGVVTRT